MLDIVRDVTLKSFTLTLYFTAHSVHRWIEHRSTIKGENPQINQRMMMGGGLEYYLDISLIQIKA